MQFLEKTAEPGKFIVKEGDVGNVSLNEIVVELDNPMDDLKSSSRHGKISFSLQQIEPFLDTLN